VSPRWPYALALTFVILGLVGVGLSLFVWAPLVLACYAALPALGFAAYRAFAWRASFRVVIAVGVGLMLVGVLAFVLTLVVSWLATLGVFSDSTSFFLIEWLGFSSVVGLPIPGALVALVGLIGALTAPGTPPTPKVRPAPVGSID
jgi:hypothetical protein